MNAESAEDVQISTYLLSYAPLASFYIYQEESGGGLLINFWDEEGGPWVIMEDDDVLYERAADFLIKNGAPVFQNDKSLREYESSRKSCD